MQIGKIKIAMHWQILIALLLAIPFGLFLKPAVPYVSWMGDVFLNGLKMIVIPLILSSVISSIASIGGGDDFGRLGLKTVSYYVFTSLIAIMTGLFFVNLIKPGIGVDTTNISGADLEKLPTGNTSIGETLINIVPSNIFEALTNNEILSVIFFAIIVGIFITKLKPAKSKLLTDVVDAIFDLFMQITMFVIKLAPFGIFGLITKVIAEQKDFKGMMISLGAFMLTVMLALAVHAFVWIPLITKVVGKASPIKHFRNVSACILTAFSTASSAAALPLNMSLSEKKSGVSEKIANFTLPIGATVNMDGTAIYIAAVVMFIAQTRGETLGFEEQFIILLTALLTSIGTAAIPMGSLVVITIILNILNLPFELLAVILPVDRILDMFRTATNVWSDSCGAVVIAKSEGEKLNV